MAAERDLELLDDYLANRLDGNARSAFEQKLTTDPELKGELELQQQFINGIKKARVAELKSILNNVPVPAVQHGGTAVAAKIAIWTAVVGVVSTGLYLYLNQPEETSNTPEIKTEQVQKETPVTPPQEQTEQPNDGSPVVSEEESSSEQKPAEAPKSLKKDKVKPEPTTKDPKIDVFDPTKEESENKPAQEDKEPVLPQVSATDIAVEVDSNNKKYTFHYQFKEGKLFLYGPFEKNLYEIMEFFSEDKRTLFLFYKDDYYLLKDDNQKLKPLNTIQDPALVKKLKEYRDQN
jgi:hypothetical protein